MKMRRSVTLSPRQVARLAADATMVAATTVLYAPEVEKRAHAAAVRILNQFTDWRKAAPESSPGKAAR